MSWLCGSAAYMAPEVAQRRVPYDSAVDLWSAGVVLHLLLTGLTPFTPAAVSPDMSADDAALAGAAAAQWRVSFAGPEWADVSPAAVDLCRRLLSVSASDRPEAARALMHEWFSSADADAKADKKRPLAGTLAQLRRYAAAVQLPVRDFPAGALIGKQGERCTSVYLIKQGTVEVLLADDAPQDVEKGGLKASPSMRVLTRHGAGELVGEVVRHCVSALIMYAGADDARHPGRRIYPPRVAICRCAAPHPIWSKRRQAPLQTGACAMRAMVH